MQDPVARRYLVSAIFALLAGALVAVWNPMDHVKADLRADTSGLRVSLEMAEHAFDGCLGSV